MARTLTLTMRAPDGVYRTQYFDNVTNILFDASNSGHFCIEQGEHVAFVIFNAVAGLCWSE